MSTRDYVICIVVLLIGYGIYYNFSESPKAGNTTSVSAPAPQLPSYRNLWKNVIPDFGTVIEGKPDKEGCIYKKSKGLPTILNGEQNIKMFVSKKNILYAYELCETVVGADKCKEEIKRIGKVLANTEPLVAGLRDGSIHTIRMSDAIAEIKIKESPKNYFLLTLKISKK